MVMNHTQILSVISVNPTSLGYSASATDAACRCCLVKQSKKEEKKERETLTLEEVESTENSGAQ